MRGQRTILGSLLLLLLLVLVGCRTQEHYLRPPKSAEEIAGVPANDPRYENYPKFPAEAMANGKKQGQGKNNTNGMTAGGMGGGGMGGMGGGGMGMGGMGGMGGGGMGMGR